MKAADPNWTLHGREEWNFDAVPREELLACCLWEYARESATLTAPKEYVHRHHGKRHILELAPAARGLLERVFALPAAQSFRLYHLLCVFSGVPWLALPPGDRERNSLLISTEVSAMRLARLCELQDLLSANPDHPETTIGAQVKLGAPKAAYTGRRRQSPLACAEPGPLSLSEDAAGSGSQSGWCVVALAVNYALYSDSELSEAFARLVAVHRPPQFKHPHREEFFTLTRGKKERDWRVALRRLGVMRALHYSSFASPRFPGAFKARGEKACYFDRAQALKTFRTLFPFLPHDEQPLHWREPRSLAKVRTKSR